MGEVGPVWRQLREPRLEYAEWEYAYMLLKEDGVGIPLGYVYDPGEEFPYAFEIQMDPEEFHKDPRVEIFFAETVKEAMDSVEEMVEENGYGWAKEMLDE